MSIRKPPGVATWLLDKLGYTRRNAALAGDLLEEFRNGRSRAWYWRQTANVIGSGFRRNGFSAGILVACGFVFLIQALIDYGFWRMHRPLVISFWKDIAVVMPLSIAAIGIRTRNKHGAVILKRILLVLVVWMLMVCFGAWTSSATLTHRLTLDFGVAAAVWAGISVSAREPRRNRRSR